MASEKTLARLEAQIHRRAAHCLQFEVSDPRANFVTITRVELAKDLSVAKVHYSVLGGPAEQSKARHLLDHAGGFVQRQVASILRTRRAPQLRFFYDDSLAEAARLDLLIRDARARDERIRGGSAPDDEPEPTPDGDPGAGADAEER